MPPQTPTPLPVTVIGGYLGAGKTTLVNHLLRRADGMRLAVLVNEFGALPIDADLIESQDENVINIAGGCVCCSYGSELISALIALDQLDPAPDHVLIEASGVALPDAIAQSVTLIARYRIDAILVLADAETVKRHGTDRYLADTIQRQFDASDIILLNKRDMVTATQLADTREWLDEIAPAARIIETEKADISGHALLGSGIGAASSPGRARPELPHAKHHSATLRIAGPIDPHALADTLAAPIHDLIRAKGLVTGLDGQTYAVQTVGRRQSVTCLPHPPTEIGQVVCIRCNDPVEMTPLTESVSALRLEKPHADPKEGKAPTHV